MKITAPAKEVLENAKQAACFRAGMAAHETVCWLREVARVLREPSIKKASRELRTTGVRALEKAHEEALRLRELLPVRGGYAGIVARKTKVWAESLQAPSPKKKTENSEAAFLRDSRNRLHKLGEDVKAMYAWGLSECGLKVTPEAVLQELYPDRKKKK